MGLWWSQCHVRFEILGSVEGSVGLYFFPQYQSFQVNYQDRGGSCEGEGLCRLTCLFAAVAPVGVFPLENFWLTEVM